MARKLHGHACGAARCMNEKPASGCSRGGFRFVVARPNAMAGKLYTRDGPGNGFRPFKWHNSVMRTPGLSVHAVAVAAVLLWIQRNGEIEAVRVETLAKHARCSKRSAQTGLAELRRAGLVEPVRRQGRKGHRLANGYRLCAEYASRLGAISAPSAPGLSAECAPHYPEEKGRDGEIFATVDWPE